MLKIYKLLPKKMYRSSETNDFVYIFFRLFWKTLQQIQKNKFESRVLSVLSVIPPLSLTFFQICRDFSEICWWTEICPFAWSTIESKEIFLTWACVPHICNNYERELKATVNQWTLTTDIQDKIRTKDETEIYERTE